MAFFDVQCADFFCTVCMLKGPEPLLTCYLDNLCICWDILNCFLDYPRVYTDIYQNCNYNGNKDPFCCVMTHLMTLLFVASRCGILKMFPLGRALVLWV